jgi:hypothetical protein
VSLRSILAVSLLLLPSLASAQRYVDQSGRLRIALAMQPFSPNGASQGPKTMASALFEQIFRRYPKASAIGFATIPSTDEGGVSIAAVNLMIAGAVRGLRARKP